MKSLFIAFSLALLAFSLPATAKTQQSYGLLSMIDQPKPEPKRTAFSICTESWHTKCLTQKFETISLEDIPEEIRAILFKKKQGNQSFYHATIRMEDFSMVDYYTLGEETPNGLALYKGILAIHTD